MDLLQKRSTPNKDDLLEKRFIQHVLKEEGERLDEIQRKLMISRGFSNDALYSGRVFSVTDTQLSMTHPMVLRFIDMKYRKSTRGSNKKVSHPIHNAPIYGVANEIIVRLRFDFTQKMKDYMASQSD